MTVHYRPVEQGGMQALYLAHRPEGDLDSIVRSALDIHDIPVLEAEHPSLRDAASRHDHISFISSSEEGMVYHSLRAPIPKTCLYIDVPQSGDILVGINSHLGLPRDLLESLIDTVVIKHRLAPAGLAPSYSRREDIPRQYLTDEEASEGEQLHKPLSPLLILAIGVSLVQPGMATGMPGWGPISKGYEGMSQFVSHETYRREIRRISEFN